MKGIFAAVAIGLLGLGWSGGYYWTNQRGELRLANLERLHQQQLIEANARYRLLEQQHSRQIRELSEEYSQREREQRDRDTRIIADLRNGVERLRFEISTKYIPIPAPADATTDRVDAADDARLEGQASEVVEIAPHVAEELWAIAAKGDEAIRKLNALQQWVNTTLGVYVDVAAN